jgi:hypothetical protein
MGPGRYPPAVEEPSPQEPATAPPQAPESWLGKNVVFVLTALPFLIAAARVVLFAGGDQALLTTLLQTINVPAIILGSVVPAGLLILMFAAYLAIADPKVWPAMVALARRSPAVAVYVLPPLLIVIVAMSSYDAALAIAAGLGLAGLARLLWTRWSRKRGKTWRGWVEDSTAFTVFLVVGLLTAGPMWLPSESVTTSDGAARMGYVLSADGEWTTVLTNDRVVLRLASSDVVAREVCNESHPATLMQWMFHWQPQRACPADKPAR